MNFRTWESAGRSLVLSCVLLVLGAGNLLAQDASSGNPSPGPPTPAVDQTVMVLTPSPWNTLEVVKLTSALLVPAALIFISVWMDRRIKQFEHRQWTNQKVIEKRMEVYEKITPKLNDVMCYFLRVGTWKRHSPTEIVNLKRDLDQTAHIYAPLFPAEFLVLYNNFMRRCFVMFRGDGKDAQLCTEQKHYVEVYSGEWCEEWNDLFVEETEAVKREDVRSEYQKFVSYFAHELGVGLERPRYDEQGNPIKISKLEMQGSADTPAA